MKVVKVMVPDDFDPDTGSLTVNADSIWKPKYTTVLDHGFVGMVDFMGTDDAIVQAARVSYGSGTKKVREDRGLIRYLMRHAHTTPFEMVQLKYHVKAPIFVFRQWHRHRTFSINEMSARYSKLDNEMYIPAYANAAPQAVDNKQGRSGGFNQNDYNAICAALEQVYEDSFTTYEYLLGPEMKTDSDGNQVLTRPALPDAINVRRVWVEDNALRAINEMQKRAKERGESVVEFTKEQVDEKIREHFEANDLYITGPDYPGLARELSRMVLPLSAYSQMYWCGNLKNLLGFIKLRSDAHAQYEIRVYSDAIRESLMPLVPWCMEAFTDYQMDAKTLSRFEIKGLREYIDFANGHIGVGEGPNFATFMTDVMKTEGASDREIREFLTTFQGK